jgi:thiosulfate/3-mercaptopyruvate sulfurtransferase
LFNDPVIEPVDLVSIGPVRLLDVRDEEAFSTAHFPAAVRVPVEEWEAAAEDEATSLDNKVYRQKQISALGIDNGTLAIIYDDGRMTEAARVWFVLQHFGERFLAFVCCLSFD